MKKFLSLITACALLTSTLFVFSAYAVPKTEIIDATETNTADSEEIISDAMPTAYEYAEDCRVYGGIVYYASRAVSDFISFIKAQAEKEPVHVHYDKNGDYRCDYCGADTWGGGIAGPIEPY